LQAAGTGLQKLETFSRTRTGHKFSDFTQKMKRHHDDIPTLARLKTYWRSGRVADAYAALGELEAIRLAFVKFAEGEQSKTEIPALPKSRLDPILDVSRPLSSCLKPVMNALTASIVHDGDSLQKEGG
jgi:hypothetical protein